MIVEEQVSDIIFLGTYEAFVWQEVKLRNVGVRKLIFLMQRFVWRNTQKPEIETGIWL